MVFPISDDNTDRTAFPVINVALILVNVIVFVVFQQMGSNVDFTFAFSTVPAEIVRGQDIVTDSRTVQVQSVDGPQQVVMPGLGKTPIPVYLTLITSMFMQSGPYKVVSSR